MHSKPVISWGRVGEASECSTANSLANSDNKIFMVEPEGGGQDPLHFRHPAASAVSVVPLDGCRFVPVVVSVCFECDTDFPEN